MVLDSRAYLDRTQMDRLFAGLAVVFYYDKNLDDIRTFNVKEVWENQPYTSVFNKTLTVGVSNNKCPFI